MSAPVKALPLPNYLVPLSVQPAIDAIQVPPETHLSPHLGAGNSEMLCSGSAPLYLSRHASNAEDSLELLPAAQPLRGERPGQRARDSERSAKLEAALEAQMAMQRTLHMQLEVGSCARWPLPAFGALTLLIL